mgnify:CR=1 FL=1
MRGNAKEKTKAYEAPYYAICSELYERGDAYELLKQIKAYRNDMVARNYPFQQISDIITKWEMRDVSTDPFKGTSIEGKD